jgi:hypothetical protein
MNSCDAISTFDGPSAASSATHGIFELMVQGDHYRRYLAYELGMAEAASLETDLLPQEEALLFGVLPTIR